MALIQRFTNPLLTLLPDLSNVPVQRQALGALIASVLLHLLLLLFVIVSTKLLPSPTLEFAKAKPRIQELELTLMPAPAEPEEFQIVTLEQLPDPFAKLETIPSTGLTKSDEAPSIALFQSDQNMKAGAERIEFGSAPLPSMDGLDRPFMNFTTQDVLLGSSRVTPFKEDISLGKPLPSPDVPMEKPQPVPSDQPPSPSVAVEKPLPLPATTPAPKAIPPPLPEVKQPNKDEIALAEKQKPTPGPVTRVIPTLVRPRPMPVQDADTPPPPPLPSTPVPDQKPEMAKIETPPPGMAEVAEGKFQEEQVQTKVEGSITNLGKPGVDAVKTPLGVYRKQVRSAIASRWYYYLRQRQDLAAFGSVKIGYSITREGKIVDVKVISNTSNQALASICEQSIREAEVGPPPEEALAVMNDGRLEEDENFTYYDSH